MKNIPGIDGQLSKKGFNVLSDMLKAAGINIQDIIHKQQRSAQTDTYGTEKNTTQQQQQQSIKRGDKHIP